jgi:hypothetical protein
VKLRYTPALPKFLCSTHASLAPPNDPAQRPPGDPPPTEPPSQLEPTPEMAVRCSAWFGLLTLQDNPNRLTNNNASVPRTRFTGELHTSRDTALSFRSPPTEPNDTAQPPRPRRAELWNQSMRPRSAAAPGSAGLANPVRDLRRTGRPANTPGWQSGAASAHPPRQPPRPTTTPRQPA